MTDLAKEMVEAASAAMWEAGALTDYQEANEGLKDINRIYARAALIAGLEKLMRSGYPTVDVASLIQTLKEE